MRDPLYNHDAYLYIYCTLGLTPNTLYKIRVKAGTEMGYPNPPSDSQWVEYRTAGNTNGKSRSLYWGGEGSGHFQSLGCTFGMTPMVSFTLCTGEAKRMDIFNL